jgi:DNA-binding LacI/PurR family transcriptional regulator/GAF domain-containing protein
VRENSGTDRKDARPTIGFLTHTISDAYGALLWAGAMDAAREGDANLICYPGWALDSTRGFEAQANVLYHLASGANVDGLVLSSGVLSNFVGLEGFRDFCERYRPLPMASIALALEGVPSVLAENYQGVREVMTHLIEVHGYRRLAFISGPPNNLEAEARYQGYADGLAEYGLSLKLALVSPPTNWDDVSGVAAMRLLLDERGLLPQVDFEAVVTGSDNAAFGALAELQARGVHVPEDVAVTGFDAQERSGYLTPPLTSVRQPIYKQGRLATEMVLAQLQGREVQDRVYLPTELVVRQSCGCLDPAVVQAALGPATYSLTEAAMDETFKAALADRRELILSDMIGAVGVLSEGITPGWAEQLLETFVAEIEGESPGNFLPALEGVLRQVVRRGGEVSVWQGALSALRRHALSCPLGRERLGRAEDLWQQARVMIGETAQRARAYRQFQAEQQAEMLRDIGQALITSFDIAELMEVTARELPGVGISSCCLSLYEHRSKLTEGEREMPPQTSKLILAYSEKGRVDLKQGGQRFLSRELAPEGLLPSERRYVIVAKPLYFREHQIGFALLEMVPGQENMYEILRSQLSSALEGALLLQERTRAEKALEQAYAEVESRALQLHTAAEVSRAVSSILDPEDLIQQVVNLVRERFGLYYVGLFLMDQTGEWTRDQGGRLEPGKWAVLRAGTGEAGQQMVALGHKLEVGGESMIGQCVANKEPRVALDVGEEAMRFDNPLLPETRSELALPLISRGQAIGALTIQSAEEAAFGDEDITAWQTMVDQLANAIASARLYDQTQAALREMEASQRRYVQQVWEDYTFTPEASEAYLFSQTEKETVAEPWLPVVEAAVQRGEVIVEHDGQDDSMLAIPLTVHGEVMGVLGGCRSDGRGWSEGEIAEIQDIVEQLALALESQRLFDEAQQSTFLMSERVRELDTLNDIGREMEQTPPVPEFLAWVAERLPAAMRHSDVCLAAVELEGQVYGQAEAMEPSRQMVQTLRVGGEAVGRIYVAYTEDYDFIDEESALLGDVSRRVSGYIENQRLLQVTEAHAQRERRVRTVTDRMRRGTDTETIVRVALEELSQVLGTSELIVRLGSRPD